MTRRISLLLCTGLLCALSAALIHIPRPLSTAITFPQPRIGDGPMPPQTLSEWLKDATLIIEGTVVRVVKEGYTAGFDPQTGAALWVETPSGAVSPGTQPTPTPAPWFPATDFEIKVDTVYRDDGAITSGNPLIVGVLGRLNSSDTDQSAMPQIGHRYLFVLNQNPDKTTYAAPRTCGVMTLTSNRLQCVAQEPLPPFMQGITASEFLDRLRNAVVVAKQ